MDRYAAVLIPIVAASPNDVVFIERAHHLRRHAGEIGFPGGAVDDDEAGDHERTALRELEEEIGIASERVTVIGRLQPVRQRINAFTVTPFVGIVDPAAPIALDANEVAAIHRVPLASVLAPGAVHRGVEHVGDRQIETYQLDAAGIHVWGLTGRILALFVERYHEPGSPLRAALDEGLSV